VQIEEARGRDSEFTLDRNGFALVKAPTACDLGSWLYRDFVPDKDEAPVAASAGPPA